MLRSKYRFSLDIKLTQSQVSIPVMFNDTIWGFLINLIDDGKAFDLPDGSRAVFVAKKPDGNTLLNDCIIEKNHIIRYDFTPNTANVEGTTSCEIRVYGPTGRMLTCPRFTMVVDSRVILDDDIIFSDSEKTAIDSILASETQREIAEARREEIIKNFLENGGASVGGSGSGGTGTPGAPGADGVGIESIRMTKRNGLEDTYTITFTDKRTTTFIVTNGKDGRNGTDGNDGITPHIGTNGNWWIGDMDTGVSAQGSGGGVVGGDGCDCGDIEEAIDGILDIQNTLMDGYEGGGVVVSDVKIDPTLKNEGEAADAKAVGDLFESLGIRIDDLAGRIEDGSGDDYGGRLDDIEEAIGNLQYKEIAITKLTVSRNPAVEGKTGDVFEVGEEGDIRFEWATNKTPKTLKWMGSDYAETKTYDNYRYTGYNASAKSTFTLEVTDERDAKATKSVYVNVYFGVYYGVSDKTSGYDSEFVSKLTKSLQSGRATNFTVTAGSGQYIFFCAPSGYKFGDCTFKVGGFEGGFSLVDTILFTNAYDVTVSYNIYRSENTSLGSTTVSVS